MVILKTLQAYVQSSKIFGEFGDPWDITLGVDYFARSERTSGST